MMIYISLSLCVCVCVLQHKKKANLPAYLPSQSKIPSIPTLTANRLSQTKKRPENYIHQTTSFFKSASAPNPTSSSSPLLLNLPFLPASNSSRIFKYTSSTKFCFSAEAASSSRIPRIPGPAQGNVKKDFERWMRRAKKRC